ncbi:MAG: T9SS type A sorting domain-containing protein [Candidatus Kapaibacterium sp.]
MEISPEERGREFARETLREKIRFDLDKAYLLPTVGELRAQLARDSEKGEGSLQAAPFDGVVSADQAPESEVHAAINPMDSANIIVSPIRQATQSLLCPIYYTKDFGKTWSKSSYVNLPPFDNVRVVGGGDPVFAFDANGRAYFTWINIFVSSNFQTIYSGMFWVYSDDGGATWKEGESTIVTIDQGSINGGVTVSDKQWMAVDKSASSWRNQLYVAFVELDSQLGASQIVVRRLAPESMEFVQESVPVSTSNFNLVQFSSIDVDVEGYVHVSFFGEHRTAGWGMWHSMSTDGGKSFSTPNRISSVRFGSTRFGAASNKSITGIQNDRLYPAPHIAIDQSSRSSELGGGNIYAAWTGLGVTSDEGKGYNIYCARSTDNGVTWQAPIIVHDDNGSTSDQFYSSVSVNENGVVVVSWYDNREDVNKRLTHYRVACSFDEGKTFGPSVAVTSQATDFQTIGSQNGDFGVGEYTQVLTTRNYVIPVWSDGRKGNGNMDIYIGFLPINKSSLSVDQPERVSTVNHLLTDLALAPNPVTSDVATLHFRLSHRTLLQVDILNNLGESVRSVVGGELFPSGANQLTLPVSGLTSGEYFVRIKTSEGTISQKLTVVR